MLEYMNSIMEPFIVNESLNDIKVKLNLAKSIKDVKKNNKDLDTKSS